MLAGSIQWFLFVSMDSTVLFFFICKCVFSACQNDGQTAMVSEMIKIQQFVAIYWLQNNYIKWASTWEKVPFNKPNEYSYPPAHPCSLIRDFVVLTKKLCILDYQNVTSEDSQTAQSALNLRRAHMSEGTFSDVTAKILFPACKWHSYNVASTSWCCIDLEATLYKRLVPTRIQPSQAPQLATYTRRKENKSVI